MTLLNTFNGLCQACGTTRRIEKRQYCVGNVTCYDERCATCGTKRPFGYAHRDGPKMHCLIIGQPGHPHWLPLHEAAKKAGFAVYSANKEMPPRIYCKKQWRELADEVCRSVGAEPWVRTPMPKQWGTAVVTEDIVEV